MLSHKERPWREYYVTNGKEVNPSQTLYQAYTSINADNLDEIAVYSLSESRTFSHRELMERIDAFAASMVRSGFSEKSKIGAVLLNTIEVPVALLASDKIGAEIKFVDYSKSIEDIINNIMISNFDLIIVDEVLIEIVNHLPVFSGLVVVTNASNYLCLEGQMLISDFLKLGENTYFEARQFEEGKSSVVIYSSGTTGKPKPIVHSDYAINIAANNVLVTDLLMKRGNLMVCNIPSFIGMGLITCMYSSLLAGVALVFIDGTDPDSTIEKTLQFFRKYHVFKANFNIAEDAKVDMITSPMFYRMIANDNSITDLSFLGGLLAGGSKMGKKELDVLNGKYWGKGCLYPICNGYGQNEMCGAVTLNSISHNKNGSAGYPTKYTEVRIVNPETFEDVECGCEGLVIERSKSRFLCYENMPEATKAAKIKLKDGSEWHDTKDLGYLDEEGFLFITGRTTRVIIVQDCKISLDGIEQKIRAVKGISDCAVIIDCSDETEKAVAFVVLTGELEKNAVMSEIEKSDSNLSHFEKPDKIYVIEQMPYLASNKIDYKLLSDKLKNINL